MVVCVEVQCEAQLVISVGGVVFFVVRLEDEGRIKFAEFQGFLDSIEVLLVVLFLVVLACLVGVDVVGLFL